MDVVIVDDEPAGRRALKDLCAQEQDLRVVGEFADAAAALPGIVSLEPQLLFLDIQMGAMSGIELARSLIPAKLPSLVFVTAYDNYALEAFEVCAVDYLLKPFDRPRFQQTLARVRPRQRAGDHERQAVLTTLLEQLERSTRSAPVERARLLGELNGRLHVLDAADVEVVESDRNYVTLRVGNVTYHARSTLTQAEAALAAQPMLRISRSCLVNVDYLKELNRTLRGDFIFVMRGGATITSSEGFRARVKDYLSTLRIAPL